APSAFIGLRRRDGRKAIAAARRFHGTGRGKSRINVILSTAFIGLLLAEGGVPAFQALTAAGATLALGALAWSIRRKERARGTEPGDGPVYSYRGGPNPDADPWTTLNLEKLDRSVEWFSGEGGVKG